LLVDAARVLHANHAARMELDAEHPLQVVGDTLRVREAQDLMPLHQALLAARGGQRKLVTLGRGDGSVSVAVTPLGLLGLGGPAATLLLLGKRKVCATLTVQMFARCHGLTPAEARVLEALSAGIEPRELTQLHGVADHGAHADRRHPPEGGRPEHWRRAAPRGGAAAGGGGVAGCCLRLGGGRQLAPRAGSAGGHEMAFGLRQPRRSPQGLRRARAQWLARVVGMVGASVSAKPMSKDTS
jgi:hypothetical protein